MCAPRSARCSCIGTRTFPLFNEAFDLFFRAHGSSELNLPLFSLGERARVVTRRDAGAPRRLDVQEEGANDAAAAAFALGAYSTVEVSRTKDFADFTAAELEAARRLLMRLQWVPGLRRTRRWKRGVHGDIDMPRLAAPQPDARWRIDRAAAAGSPRCPASDRAAGRRERIDGSI